MAQDFITLLDQLGTIAEKRSQLSAAEGKFRVEVGKLLTDAAARPSHAGEIPPQQDGSRGFTDQFLSVVQAAEYLNISPKTLNQWRVRGGGPEFARIGRLIRYSRKKLAEYASEQTYSHTSAYR